MSSTVASLIGRGKDYLLAAGVDDAVVDAGILLGHVLKKSRTEIILRPDFEAGVVECEKYEDVLKRRAGGEPTAYITGEQDFYGRTFRVDSAVLIPRPETEELVEWVLKENSGYNSVLDLCCGSGCVGITLGMEGSPDYICLADISAKALEVAKINANILRKGVRVDFIESDLFSGIAAGGFDLIVTNPPYVTADEYEYLDRSVRDFEPRNALVVERPGFFNRELCAGAFEHLRPGGKLYVETGPGLIDSLVTIMSETGFSSVVKKRDLSGKERFVRGAK